jgi:hypothetical protein
VERVALFILPSGINKEGAIGLQSLGFDSHAQHGFVSKQSLNRRPPRGLLLLYFQPGIINLQKAAESGQDMI